MSGEVERIERALSLGSIMVADAGMPQTAAAMRDAARILATRTPSDADRTAVVEECARDTIRDALLDSQYLAGVTAGWNAAQSDEPESALAALQRSRAGHLAGFKEAKAAIRRLSTPAGEDRP